MVEEWFSNTIDGILKIKYAYDGIELFLYGNTSVIETDRQVLTRLQKEGRKKRADQEKEEEVSSTPVMG